ncbi:hypothetical protein B0T14DRAFT_534647 [Immersiella caudata]|uniref:Proteasome assembly chaperone 3 n=1 Tax=Immersiella caudata TaxID=314043 RepID=A0AA40C624_9PEZI|nr:hypothetical protein B0T14DRAFT_534647 [Immersiella caudata]
MADNDVRDESFPASSKQITGTVNSIQTETSRVDFSDKIVITVSQAGRLAQWIQVPLSAPSAASVDMSLPGADSMLPSTHFTPRTLLGGANEERETVGQLFAAQTASLLSLRDPEEKRTLLLGLGLEKVESNSDAFYDLMELLQQLL